MILPHITNKSLDEFEKPSPQHDNESLQVVRQSLADVTHSTNDITDDSYQMRDSMRE